MMHYVEKKDRVLFLINLYFLLESEVEVCQLILPFFKK